MSKNYSSNDYRGFFQDWVIAIAIKVSKEFQSKWKCLEREDLEDLLQECLSHWYSVRDAYDPAREASQKTFMGRVIRNKLMDLVREREAARRIPVSDMISLSQPIGENRDDPNSPTLIDKIDRDYAEDRSSEIDSRIDITTILQKLTPRQREICRLLGEEGLTVKEASEYLKTPRSTICEEKKRIRAIFEKEGLRDYLEQISDTFREHFVCIS